MTNRPKTVLEVLAEMWCEDFPQDLVTGWNDDARWFAGAYAKLLRAEGHEMASDYLRRLSESK